LWAHHHPRGELSPASGADHIQPFQPELVTDHLPHFLIQRKYSNRRTSHRCQSAKFDTERDKRGDIGGKVVKPPVLARMKEIRDKAGRWVDSLQVGSFFQIARPTGECKVVQVCRSAMLPGDNMFDVESAAKRLLRQAAGFTTIASALPYRLGWPTHAGCCNF
jgi:hypothetical protein